MKLEEKTLRRTEWDNISDNTLKTMSVKDERFEGTIGLMTIHHMDQPFIVPSVYGDIIIADTNYQWLQFAPKKQNWWLTTMFDPEGQLIESYFDITQKNTFENEQNPHFIDMKLDIAIHAHDDPVLLDKDELLEAFNKGLITEAEYTLALRTAQDIIDFYTQNKDEYFKLILHYYHLLEA